MEIDFQIIGANAASKYGGRRVLCFAVLLWSLSTVVTPLAASYLPLLICTRVVLGLGEGLGEQLEFLNALSLLFFDPVWHFTILCAILPCTALFPYLLSYDLYCSDQMQLSMLCCSLQTCKNRVYGMEASGTGQEREFCCVTVRTPPVTHQHPGEALRML